MSGLRQRGVSQLQQQTGTQLGIQESESERRPKPSLYMSGTAGWKNDEVEDIIRKAVLPRTQSKRSNSDEAQTAKKRLEADPYNLDRIIDLGYTYASEYQYQQAAQVLLRGWKRVGEIKAPGERFMFLLKLAEVSFCNRQYTQAHAVLMDVEQPQDYYEKKAYQLLSCHAHAEIGDRSSALAVFSKAIDGEEFGTVIKIWSACAIRLKQVGAHQPGKEALLKKARRGQNFIMDQSRIETVESWAIMSDTPENTKGWFNYEDGVPKWMVVAFAMFMLSMFMGFLHWLEKQSLRNMKML